MSRFIAPLILALTFLFGSLTGGMAAEPLGKRTVSVTGIGIAKARPDTASISIGVVSEGETAKEALDKNTAAMSRIIVELKGQKVDPKDIQTTNFTVRPKFQHFKDGKPPAIIGYRVVNSVRIKVRVLKMLGVILDQAVSIGSNQINGIAFSVEDAASLEDNARKLAMTNAKHKAELYASAGNTKLGKVLVISEDFITRPPRPMFGRAAMSAKAAPVPIEPGEHRVEARVHVSWELKN
jgi:uncharacterized protein YggE